ncbi:hypothetical protein [Mucilaginibacter terrae]|uniref:Uncharacterized protein n=1 Tax=Mucilaginibacter terrae TaxID=1955052 RepID=A0ABU3H1N2_9SPHI|nr:hypothetical protein [Mucilaginibacter terrae]MDT3404825.1 hypothetical protein [Mucilaginibacter terrae]
MYPEIFEIWHGMHLPKSLADYIVQQVQNKGKRPEATHCINRNRRW